MISTITRTLLYYTLYLLAVMLFLWTAWPALERAVDYELDNYARPPVEMLERGKGIER